jgi:3-oxoacyl-[acyl-carrier-protein] synthase III
MFISGTSYILGESVFDATELPELAADAELRATLTEFGVREYRATSLDALALAARAAKKALDDARLAPELIDTVLLASSTLPHDAARHGAPIAHFLEDANVTSAYPIAVSGSFCGNAQSALRVSRALIRSGDAERILIVCTDVVTGPTRIVPPSISVASDGAAACIATRDAAALLRNPKRRATEPVGVLELLDVVQGSSPKIERIDAEREPMAYIEAVGRELGQLVRVLLERNRMTPKDIRQLIVNNYNTYVMTSVAKLFGFEREQVFLDNVQRTAHVNSADNLINACDLLKAGRVAAGERVLVVGTGPSLWGASLLRVVGAEDP